MLFAEGIWNDRLESGIRRRASRAARFARSRAPLVQNHFKKNEDTARYGQVLPHTHSQTGKNTIKIHAKRYPNARRERNGAQRAPPGSRRERKGCQMEPTAPQRIPKGAKRVPKGDQNDPKMLPKCPKMPPCGRDGTDR